MYSDMVMELEGLDELGLFIIINEFFYKVTFLAWLKGKDLISYIFAALL